MSQTQEDEFTSLPLSSGTFTQLQKEIGVTSSQMQRYLDEDIVWTPQTNENPLTKILDLSKQELPSIEDSPTLSQVLTPKTVENVLTNSLEAIQKSGFPAEAQDLSTNQRREEETQDSSTLEFPVKEEGVVSLNVTFKETRKITKWMSCTYSETTATMYARFNVKCATIIRISGTLPPHCSLLMSPRFMSVQHCTYSELAHLDNALSNCPYHASNGHFVQVDKSFNQHISYGFHGSSKHQFTALDLKNSPDKTVIELVIPVRYTCRSSCQGGINKKPFQVLYSVVCGGREVVGKALTTWVGECPGRARKTAEIKEAEGVHCGRGGGEVVGSVDGGVTLGVGLKRKIGGITDDLELKEKIGGITDDVEGVEGDKPITTEKGVNDGLDWLLDPDNSELEGCLEGEKRVGGVPHGGFTRLVGPCTQKSVHRTKRKRNDASYKENQYMINAGSFKNWKFINRFLEGHQGDECHCNDSVQLGGWCVRDSFNNNNNNNNNNYNNNNYNNNNNNNNNNNKD